MQLLVNQKGLDLALPMQCSFQQQLFERVMAKLFKLR